MLHLERRPVSTTIEGGRSNALRGASFVLSFWWPREGSAALGLAGSSAAGGACGEPASDARVREEG
jgi:hypothetical protein